MPVPCLVLGEPSTLSAQHMVTRLLADVPKFYMKLELKLRASL